MKAKSKYVRVSPFKLRPYADVIRGATVERAFAWLKTWSLARLKPLEKTLHSAYSNAKSQNQTLSQQKLVISEIRIDGGPMFKYFTPAAQGRAVPQRKRLSHIEIKLEVR